MSASVLCWLPSCPAAGTYVPTSPRAPLLAGPAACLQVCDDLRSILKIDGCELFRSSVNRPNLFYEVGGWGWVGGQVGCVWGWDQPAGSQLPGA